MCCLKVDCSVSPQNHHLSPLIFQSFCFFSSSCSSAKSSSNGVLHVSLSPPSLCHLFIKISFFSAIMVCKNAELVLLGTMDKVILPHLFINICFFFGHQSVHKYGIQIILILMVVLIYLLMTDSWWSQLLVEAFQHSRSKDIKKQ